ncbi:unnamed protein product, partial [Mesorhabditis belari]|uniref:Major facilitator superfamily (MFS) profile domain-containing protein n=1 Tax=Mesorhabditis belari TaxID=2138241 RepID=A0AAF3J269_9BILA
MWKLFLIGCVLTAITNFPAAFTHTSLNTAVHRVDEFFQKSYANRDIDIDQQHLILLRSVLNCVWYGGQVAGALVSPLICDRYGRKVAFTVSITMMTFAGTLQTLASLTDYPEILIFGRILSSCFSPLSDAALILYLQEISPSSFRGTMSSLYSTGYCVMGLAGMLIGNDHVLGHSLLILLAVPVIVGVPSILFSIIMPETPKYLWLSRKNKNQAIRSLEFYQGQGADYLSDLDEMLREASGQEKNTDKATNLFKNTALKKAFGLSICTLCLTLPFYPLLQSSTHFFTRLGVERSFAQLSSSGLMVALTISCICSTLLIDRLPRRFLLLSTGFTGIAALSLFVAFAYFEKALEALAATFVFIFAYGFGIGPIGWMIPAELVPLSNRSVMFCSCYAVHSIFVVITSFITIPLFDIYGSLCFVPIFIIPSIICLLYVMWHLPETKGREINDILLDLQGSKNARTHVADMKSEQI